MIDKKLNSKGNSVSVVQFFLVAFVATVSFKMASLQQFASQIADRKAWMAIAFLSLVEIAMLFVVYACAKKGGLQSIAIPYPLKIILAICIAFSCFSRLLCMGGEYNSYVSERVFDGAKWIYSLIALLPCVAYLAYKGGASIAKTCQILFWFVAISFVFDIAFTIIDGKFSNLLPMTFDGKVFLTCDKTLFWFCDLSPLLFLSINGKDKRYAKVFVSLSAIAMFLCPTLLAILLTVDFGGASNIVQFAFERIATLNKFTRLLGIVDLPMACAWLMNATVSLGLSVFGIVECWTLFGKKKNLFTVLTTLVFGFVSALLINSAEKSISLTTSALRYLVAAIEFLAPPIVYFFSRKVSPTGILISDENTPTLQTAKPVSSCSSATETSAEIQSETFF